MSKKPFPPPSPSPGWIFLARGEQENDAIARCPAGHIHLDYGNLTVRFHRDEFLAFAHMVEHAAAQLQGVSATVPHLMTRESPVTFSLN